MHDLVHKLHEDVNTLAPVYSLKHSAQPLFCFTTSLLGKGSPSYQNLKMARVQITMEFLVNLLLIPGEEDADSSTRQQLSWHVSNMEMQNFGGGYR